MSQMSALASGGGVSLQHELQGFLRRALGQQAGVRAALYGGLGQVLEVDAGECVSAASEGGGCGTASGSPLLYRRVSAST